MKPFAVILVLLSMWAYPVYTFVVAMQHRNIPVMLSGTHNPLVFSAFVVRMHGEDFCTIGWIPDNQLPARCSEWVRYDTH